MSGGQDAGQDRPTNPPDPAAANQQGPNDAPGAPSAVPGATEASGPAAAWYGCPVDDSAGATVIHCNRERYLDLCRGLKGEGFAMPVGVTGVDYLTHPGRALPEGIRPERFEVVVELVDLGRHRRARVRCQVPAHDPSVPSLFELWPGTEYHERETYDMFGIRFDGHPDMTRILMPDDWEGHPLRKDYDTGHVPVQFKEAPR